jgi:hypothetical protein
VARRDIMTEERQCEREFAAVRECMGNLRVREGGSG